MVYRSSLVLCALPTGSWRSIAEANLEVFGPRSRLRLEAVLGSVIPRDPDDAVARPGPNENLG